jgi:hypothetical protein
MELALGKVDEYILEFNNELHKCDNYIELKFQDQRDQFDAEVEDLVGGQPQPAPPVVQPTPAYEPAVVHSAPVS